MACLAWRFYELARINAECLRQSSEHADARGNAGAFDRAYIAHAKLRACSQLFLRQILFMAQATHVDRHDLFEIHGRDRR